MQLLYDLVFLVFAALYVPYLLVKGKLHGDFPQKFGVLPDSVKKLERPVWIHAVSVGEAQLAARLASGIKKTCPGTSVIVSTTTKTGNKMIRKAGEGVVDAIFYYPLDISVIVSRVVALVHPSVYVMMETELWPNLLRQLNRKDVPIILANGRISDSSFTNYGRIKFVTERILKCVDCFCMQTERDAERIKTLGAPGEKVFVTGNMKFDDPAGSASSGAFSGEYLGFGREDRVVVAGSTHSPEEKEIIDVYGELKGKYPDLKLVLAPRHVERTDVVRAFLERSGMKYRLFSEILSTPGVEQGATSEVDVVLVDTIGHLKDIYSVATLIFVGGSLARKGGQNPIEGASWGKTVLFGPNMYNFREVADIFLENDAAVGVENVEQLRSVARELLRDPEKRKRISANARKVIERNSGAISRTIRKMEPYITEVLGTRLS